MREGFTNYRSRSAVIHAGVDRGEHMDFEPLTVCGVVLEDADLCSDKAPITCKRCLRVLGTIERDIWGDEAPDPLAEA